MESTTSLPLLPGIFRLRVLVIVRSPSMSQIDLFTNYSYTIEPCPPTNKSFLETVIKMSIDRTMNTIP